MIGYLKGKVLAKHSDNLQCVILSHRIGFELFVPKNLFDSLQLNHTTELWIHTHVREDAFLLYGFPSEEEKQFFRVLLGVSGLGPKTAMSLLAEHGAEKLSRIIISKDIDEISSASGVGKKLAQRIVLELAGKVEKLAFVAKLEGVNRTLASASAPARPPQLREDLSSALLHLGYLPAQVKNTIEKLSQREELEALGFEAALKTALKELSGRVSPKERMLHG